MAVNLITEMANGQEADSMDMMDKRMINIPGRIKISLYYSEQHAI